MYDSSSSLNASWFGVDEAESGKRLLRLTSMHAKLLLLSSDSTGLMEQYA